eukprot:3827219-Ditylum_brightwellii.AAC.1
MGFNGNTMTSTKPVTDTMGMLSGLNIVLMGNLEVNFFGKFRRRDNLVAAEMETVVTAMGMEGTAHIPYLVP